MSSKSKQIGVTFENKIAMDLRSVLGLSKFECYRAGSSGIRAIEFADITFSDWIKYPILVECKKRASLSLDNIWPFPTKEVLGWIDQVTQARRKYETEFPNIEPLVLLCMTRTYLRSPYTLIFEPYRFPTFPESGFQKIAKMIIPLHGVEHVVVSWWDILPFVKAFVVAHQKGTNVDDR